MWKTIITAITIFTSLHLGAQQIDNEIKLANEYFSQGEVEKAILLYEKIAKDDNRITLIHNNYFFLLIKTEDYKSAEKYIDRVIRRFPNNLYYRLDKGLLLTAEGKTGTATNYFQSIIREVSQNAYLVRHASNWFINNQLTEYSIRTFETSRETLNNTALYSLELANIYRMLNERDKMVNEYLNYITANPSNIRYVKNSLQNLLTETEELEALESLLYDRIQKNPSSLIYPDLLIWVNLQLKNFYGAFVQSRALDKRIQNQGDRSFEIGTIALNNGDFRNAERIFSWIIENYPNTINYVKSRIFLIEAYEMRVKNTYPISDEEIRTVIHDYRSFINEVGLDRNTLQALRNKALLHAFYLDEKDSAIQILERIIQFPRAGNQLIAKSKLDLGDIYLLNEEPWESTLLYSQVEKGLKDSPISYEAKLRNAKLSYFKGDFLLAQEHLDIIKEATTREISNDAISLSMLIKDNIAMDSTEEAMRNYAAVELLLFQNKITEAKIRISEMITEFNYHTIIDELLWLRADVSLKEGNFEEAVADLQQIVDNYPIDILGDDAYFLMAEIYQRHLQDEEKAQEIYLDFLTKYPGSVYSAEARKRYREMRGDFDNL